MTGAHRPTAVVYDPIVAVPWSYAVERELLAQAGIDLIVPADGQAARAAATTGDILVVSAHLPPDVLAAAAHCRGILCYSVGTDSVDLATATGMGIEVRNVAGYCTDEVAEHAVALMMAAQRRLVTAAGATADGDWPSAYALLGADRPRRIRGQTVGIIGLGRIGSGVATRCLGLGMSVLAADPAVTAAPMAEVAMVPLPELLARSDVVIVCAAFTGVTVIDRDALATMRPGSLLVNVSRGAAVDEPALTELVVGGRLRAALDVRWPEPPGPDDALARHPAVLATPHMAAMSIEASADLHTMAAAVIIDLVRSTAGKPAPLPRREDPTLIQHIAADRERPLSAAVRAGDWLFISGQASTDRATGRFVPGTFAEEFRRSAENLFSVLEEAGGRGEQLVKVTGFVRDESALAEYNALYLATFSHPRPARTTVAMGFDFLRVELEAIAYLGE